MSTAIKLFFSQVWDFLLPIIKLFISSAGPILAQAAKDAVTTVALNYGTATPGTKRELAFNQILATLQAQGIQLGTSVINMAIEAAVQKLKEK